VVFSFTACAQESLAWLLQSRLPRPLQASVNWVWVLQIKSPNSPTVSGIFIHRLRSSKLGLATVKQITSAFTGLGELGVGASNQIP
jgi:hypothetical protein